MKNKDKCLVCGNRKLKLYKKVNGVKVYECTRCDFAITETKVNNIPPIKSVSTALNKYRLNEKMHAKKFKEIMLVVRNIVREGKVLEVGTGPSLFKPTSQNKRKSKEKVANLKTIYLSKKNKIREHKLPYEDFLKSNKERFDLVVFLDFPEQFKKPDTLIERTRSILLDRGIIVILTHNYRSILSNVSREWAWFNPRNSKYLFSPHSLKLFLKNRGYDIKYFTTFESYKNLNQAVMNNFSYIKDDNRRRINKAMFYGIFSPLYLLTRKVSWAAGYGQLMCVVAAKS